MRNSIKLFFCSSALFLVACFATSSCDSNKDRYVSYGFYAEVVSPSDPIKSNESGEIEIVIKSDNYKEGIDHEVNYTDNKNSVLVASTGDTIKKGETFRILKLGEVHKYKFRSEEEGEHSLKFSFKNSKGYTFTQGRLISVKKSE